MWLLLCGDWSVYRVIIYAVHFSVYLYFSSGTSSKDTRPQEDIVREKVLTVLESAYPNVLEVEDLVR